MGAGILPMAIRDGTPYYLFGREGLGQDKGYWSDFGGGKERGESFRDTALREAHEESDGILGTKEAIRELLDKHLIDQITLGGYRLYVVYVTLDTTLPKKFRKQFLNAKRRDPAVLGVDGRYEKDHVRWVSQENLRRQGRYVRPWFRRFANVLCRTNYVGHTSEEHASSCQRC